MPPRLTASSGITSQAVPAHALPGSMPWGAAVGFWLFVSVMYAGQIWWLSSMPGERIMLRAAIAWQTTYYLLWIPFTMLVWRVTADWMPDTASGGGWTRVLLRHVPLFVLVTLAHLSAVTFLASRLARENEAFWPALVGQLRGRLHLELLIYTAAAGTGAALVLHARYRDRQLAAARLEAELSAARLDALRGHLQPHFLFNSLHSIASLARAGDTAGVVRLIAGFSELLRHLLEAGERDIALRDEMQLVERYLDIQRVRFADRLEVRIDLEPGVAEARVPLLVVQPLVENALRHGLAPRVEAGVLLVRAARENGWVRIDVEDTGMGLPEGWSLASTPGTGLRNLASRLSAEFGDRASLDVAPRDGGGTRATVRIPYVAS
jgi:two-component system LytT family sensor kinase